MLNIMILMMLLMIMMLAYDNDALDAAHADDDALELEAPEWKTVG